MENWSFGKAKKREWPETDSGAPVTPVFLQHISGGPLDLELALSLLEAYGIPTVCEYPNNGLFGKLILGYPASGIDVYVPETCIEEAKNIVAAEAVEEEEPS